MDLIFIDVPLKASHLNPVVGVGHHSDNHVEKDYDDDDVVDTVQYVANTLRQLMFEDRPHIDERRTVTQPLRHIQVSHDHLGIIRRPVPKQVPEKRLERVGQAGTETPKGPPFKN